MLSLKGEAYFFRAYWHFYLLTRFGSIPVMDKFWDGNATVAGLQIPPRDRSAVAQFIIDDLKTAKNLLYSRSQYKGLRICKEAAIIMAMRVALYEGTWEKYHKGTDFAAAEDKSTDLLGQVLTLGDELFAMGLSLNTKDNDKKFVSKEDAYKYIEKTDIVYLMGGSPELEMKSIIEYNLFNILRNRNGITIGTSAGAMNQTDRVIYKDDFKNYELIDYQGLGFIDLNIYPHFDIDNKEYMDEVFEVSKYARIVGLPNESFIRIKDNNIDFVGKHYFIENGIMD